MKAAEALLKSKGARKYRLNMIPVKHHITRQAWNDYFEASSGNDITDMTMLRRFGRTEI